MAQSKLPSTQSHLDIEDIQNDLVILKNGGVSLVMETSSLNFDLLAPEEQEQRVLSFASLLNTLDFKLQIVIRTERTDVNDYIEKIVKKRESVESLALKKQMEIYIKFIRNLTTKTEVLKKRFFLVVVYHSTSLTQSTSLFDSLLGKKPQVQVAVNLQKAQDYLYPKREFLSKQFKDMGLKAVQLSNDQLTQLYYSIYDPDKVGIKRVELTEKDYTTGVVEKASAQIIDDLMTDTKENNK